MTSTNKYLGRPIPASPTESVVADTIYLWRREEGITYEDECKYMVSNRVVSTGNILVNQLNHLVQI